MQLKINYIAQHSIHDDALLKRRDVTVQVIISLLSYQNPQHFGLGDIIRILTNLSRADQIQS